MSVMSTATASLPVGAFRFSSRPSDRTRSVRATKPVRSNLASAVGPIITKLHKESGTPLPVLRRVADAIAADMRSGLAEEGGSDLKMILSYVDTLPTGNEKGLFYGLDLGGTNFRVLRVQLGGKEERVIATEFEQVSIPQDLMLSTNEELFGFIASGLARFAENESGKFQSPPRGRKREIGFTFSFPVNQTSIDSGTLIKWTKGFSVSGTEGRDVVSCLNEAMERQGLDMRVSALVNDAVGTLAGAKYWDDDVMVAVILGTGTNACYVEQLNAVPKLNRHSSSGQTIINTEWGAFSKFLPLTSFDRDMDAASINPGEQIFEKTVSGMYLGEIVRRVLLEMAESCELFGSSVPHKLKTPFALRTPDLCEMQEDKSDDLDGVGSILHNVLDVEADQNARKAVLEVCDTIVKRGGRLAAAGIVGILQKMDGDTKRLESGKRTVVAMDGGLYENYGQYREYLQEGVVELLGKKVAENVIIEHSKDGSGIGAALLAASNSKYGHDSRAVMTVK